MYLVTGAAGFTGKNLVTHLRERGVAVRAMVRSESQAAPLTALGAEPVIADLTDEDSLKPAVEGVQGIYHIAAIFRQAGLPESVFQDVNAEGTRRLLHAAISAGVPRVVHCSTVGVLSHVANPPATEDAPYNPADMYQRSKMEGEKIALEHFRSGRIGGMVIRPAMIYGPGDTRTGKLFRMIRSGRFFYVGRGEMFVHFIDVRDLAAAFRLAMEHTEIQGEIVTIAGERAVPLKEWVNFVADEFGVKRPWLHLPVRPIQVAATICEAICTPLKIQPPLFRRRVDFYTKNRHFDTRKAAQLLTFKPARSFEDELRDIVAWYDTHNAVQ